MVDRYGIYSTVDINKVIDITLKVVERDVIGNNNKDINGLD